jgi:hypothetical protein
MYDETLRTPLWRGTGHVLAKMQDTIWGVKCHKTDL